MKEKEKKITRILRIFMMLLTCILIALFFGIMILVSDMQGTARVVNYAGLVRGKTQQIIKLENAQRPQDEMIREVDAYIDGLRHGSDELNLVRLDDKAFQDKMEVQEQFFEQLKEEIYKAREEGYENTQIINKSETFFTICDETTGLAESYSQKLASSLNRLEKIVVVDIIGIVCLLGYELFKALRCAAQNRVLRQKVYLDEATGLPNKNKCEEILASEEPLTGSESTAVMEFDLNNLRIINDRQGHERGDQYIRSFAEQLRAALPEKYFVGRDGGDEFIAVLKQVDHEQVKDCLQMIREQTERYSKNHPDMPLSYAVGYALSTDFPGSNMKDLFRYADKNMYVDKNRAKMKEAADKRRLRSRLLQSVKEKGFHFTDCLYCDAIVDQYVVLRASSEFFLADDGSYSGAVEQIIQELAEEKKRRELWEKLQLSGIRETLTEEHQVEEYFYCHKDGDRVLRGRITLLLPDFAENGNLHHFLVGFDVYQDRDRLIVNEKKQLTQFYEQLTQSILENGNYIEALMDTAEIIQSVNLTQNLLEKIFWQNRENRQILDIKLPCPYDTYCKTYQRFVTKETRENYRITENPAQLIERFKAGEKQVTVEYQVEQSDGSRCWWQETVLMSQEMVYESKTKQTSTVIGAIILFKDISEFHEQEDRERERLQVAYEKADLESRAKTEFMNRMSHDIRTPINGILGMIQMIRKNYKDQEKIEECVDKIDLSVQHLSELVNDVLDMSKIESGYLELQNDPFDLNALIDQVEVVVSAQVEAMEISYESHREKVNHTMLSGDTLQIRRIMLNLFSNAIKYNKRGGRIDTYVKELSFDGVCAAFEFRITDTGVGMGKEYIKEELFKPFTQEINDARTQYKGTGLGMSIVKGLVEKMGGTIRVNSTPGVGTEFRFYLSFPVVQPEKESQNEECVQRTKQDLKEDKPLRGYHILLAEDNEINMEIAEFYLEEAGAQVTKAWNGREAAELFKQSGLREYDAVLMDIMMPELDGKEASRKIRSMADQREDAAEIPILAMTAQASTESIHQCKSAGMNECIFKPVNAKELIGLLQDIVAKI